ncbi:hypothetical protein SDC9_141240 [bioreactor metagenome]|uniref:Uncharacterized protein n=1 Tax=bioreactor metagenome TaxID=1076179 RepID=A0A645DXJ0_9ZZZZ
MFNLGLILQPQEYSVCGKHNFHNTIKVRPGRSLAVYIIILVYAHKSFIKILCARFLTAKKFVI